MVAVSTSLPSAAAPEVSTFMPQPRLADALSLRSALEPGASKTGLLRRAWLWSIVPGLCLILAIPVARFVWMGPGTSTRRAAQGIPRINSPQPNAAAVGGFSITSDPAGAEVLVDGHATGSVTPARITGLRPGLHSVGLALNGHIGILQPVTIEADAIIVLPQATFQIVALPAPQPIAAPAKPARKARWTSHKH
jgi:hypothetical protein